MPGGGTTANTGDPKTKLYVIIGVVAFVVIAIVIYALFSGSPEVKDPGPAKPVAPSVSPTPPPPTTPPPSTNAGSNATTSANAAGSADPGSGSGSGSTEPGVGSGSAATAAGSADAGSGAGSADDAPHIEMPATGGGSTKHGGGNGGGSKPPKVDASEMFQTGMRAYVGGDVRGAIGSFRKAVQAQPGYAAAWRALGLAHEKLGEWGQAKTALQRYLTLAPNAADAPQIRQRLQNL